MKRIAQVFFILSVIGLTVSCLMPVAEECSWEEGFELGIVPFGLAVVVTWIIYSGIRPKDDPSGRKFGLPRIRYGWVAIWCILIGTIMAIAAVTQIEDARFWYKSDIRRGKSGFSYLDKIEDAKVGQVVGLVIGVGGIVCIVIAGAKAIHRRRRVRLEI